MDHERILKLADQNWASEVKDSNWRIESIYRIWINKLPHCKTNKVLAEEYARQGKSYVGWGSRR